MTQKHKVLLGISGGVAAYKAVTVASRLYQAGLDVQVCMTQTATEFVGPLTFNAVTNKKVLTSLVPEKDATKLIVKAEVIEDFDDAIPEFRRESCEAGWSYFIKERLHNFFLAND